MSNPRDLIVGYRDKSAHPKLGCVVGTDGKVRAYPLKLASGEGIQINLTNSKTDQADQSWSDCKSVCLTREQALAFILAIADAIRDMK